MQVISLSAGQTSHDFKRLFFYVAGDFNIDFLKYTSETKMLLSNSYKILIDKPTSITATFANLLDHIMTDDLNNNMRCGSGLSDISDHQDVFTIIPTSFQFSVINHITHDT